MKKILIGFFLIYHMAFAQSNFGGDIFRIVQSSSGLALGSGPVSTNGDLFAILYNPSLLDTGRTIEIGVIHTRQFISDISYNYLGMGFNYNNYRISLGLARLGVDNILDSRSAKVVAGEDWGIDFSLVKKFNVADYFFLLGLKSNQKIHGFEYGITLKSVYRNYKLATAWGSSIDLGINKLFLGKIQFGLVLANFLGSGIHWSTGKNEWIYPELKYGFKYKFVPVKNIQMVVLNNFFHYFDNRGQSSTVKASFTSVDFSLGMDIMYKKTLSLRFGRNQIGNFIVGMKLIIPKIEMHYTFQKHNELGNVHNITTIFVLPYK